MFYCSDEFNKSKLKAEKKFLGHVYSGSHRFVSSRCSLPRYSRVIFTLTWVPTVVALAELQQPNQRRRCSELRGVATLAVTLVRFSVDLKFSTVLSSSITRDEKSLDFGICLWQKWLCCLYGRTRKCSSCEVFTVSRCHPIDRKPCSMLRRWLAWSINE